MNNEDLESQLIAFLTNNLEIKLDVDPSYDYDSVTKTVTVKLMLKGKEISSDIKYL